MNKQLLGIWVADLNDHIIQQEYGNISIEFKDSGEMIYTILSEGKEEKILMTFEIAGEDILITDQPSSPNKVMTKYKVNGHHLDLYFDGIQSKFIRKYY